MDILGPLIPFRDLQSWFDVMNGSSGGHYPICQEGEDTLSYAQVIDDAEEAAALRNSLQGITVPELFTALARSLSHAPQSPHSLSQTTMDDIWAALDRCLQKPNH